MTADDEASTNELLGVLDSVAHACDLHMYMTVKAWCRVCEMHGEASDEATAAKQRCLGILETRYGAADAAVQEKLLYACVDTLDRIAI